MKLQILKFAIVGLTSTVVHGAVYFLLLFYSTITPQFSNFLGFTIALLTSYFGHSLWTFNDIHIKTKVHSRLKFLVSALSSYGLNAFWVWLIEKRLHAYPEYALIGIILITPSITFILMKLWVFTDE